MDTLYRLERTIAERRAASPDASYVASLAARGLPAIARKLGEEGIETMRYLMGLGGMVLILAIAFLLSSNRRAIRPRVVLAAFALQAGIAALVLYAPWGRAALGGACPV